MPIVPRVGRRSAKIRLVLLGMYGVLVFGGVTMVAPFLVTLTASFANRYDYHHFSLLPSFLWRDDRLRMKVLFERYAEAPFELWGSQFHLRRWTTFEEASADPHPMQTESLDPLGGAPPTAAEQRRIDDYLAFLAQFDTAEVMLGAGQAHRDGYPAFLKDRYRRRLLEENPQAASWPEADQDAAAMAMLNRVHGLRVYRQWPEIQATANVRPREMRRWFPEAAGEFPDWRAYVETTPVSWRLPITATYVWHRYWAGRYGRAEVLNKAWGSSFESIYRVPFDWRGPAPGVPHEAWIDFLRSAYPARWVELPATADAPWREFLRERFDTPQRLADASGLPFASWAQVPPATHAPDNAILRQAWVEFLDARTDPQTWILRCPEREFAEFLAGRYDRSIQKLDTAYDTAFASFADVPMPIPLAEAAAFERDRGTWRWRFLTDNYRGVLRYLQTHGRAAWNTLVLVVLSVATALFVNPLAAYALSRFRLRNTHRILLFLLATMAFPAEVAMIPSFLLLRDLNLLNTYAALVLPGAANGFGIFLLKGFFDSIPQELYEAAELDGAGALRQFTTITMRLSAPILAVVALQAFLGAYGGFLWALCVCQDMNMWTLMVWLFQYQSQHLYIAPWLVMASIVLASVPTLVVYLFCQRVILRGIILPAMK